MYIKCSTRRSKAQHIVFKHNFEAQNSSEIQVYLEIHLLPHRQAESSQYKGKPVRAA
jgi:hypothetical protein